ncbi:hypothetical protein BLNAU_22763 [Blattamonas nauphoetae]|uniref:Uncharacterized protein n=1 Tax=Blattamonas nauphoetae TaxID=2049346 RepID=A0ABQ9WS49_9EUKA|nr:hypothetical protein BLNAU_22763 [Blattamonas nauphoetae]
MDVTSDCDIRFESPNGHVPSLTKFIPSAPSFCVSVVVKSIDLSSQQLTSGNSVLINFSPSQSSFMEFSEISTCVESCNIVNLTSLKSTPLIPARRLSQTCLGVSVSDSVGALQNTVVQDHNIGGSFHFQNNTLSSSTSTHLARKDVFLTAAFSDLFKEELEFLDPPYTFTGDEYSQEQSHMYWSLSTFLDLTIPPRFKYATIANPITYTDCSFTKMTEEQPDPASLLASGGSAIRLFSQAPLSVTNCTFTDCKIQLGNGGAILVASRDTEACPTVTIEDSKFVQCTSVSNGGAICISSAGTHSITRSSFTSCEAGASGGGACTLNTIYNQNIAISYSKFVSNSASMKCGGLYALSAASLMFCHFEGNTAPQHPDWNIESPHYSLTAVFGCTQSIDSKVTDDVLFVASGVEGGDCSFSSPCGSLSAALLKVGASESKEIKLGAGNFGEVHIEASSKPTICGYRRKDEWDSTKPSSSFSLLLDNPGTVTLTLLDLVPLTGASIVECTADASVSLNNLRMIGVDGISSTPFVFSAGTVTFTLCHFDSLSSMKCSLISVSATAVVKIDRSIFIQIESSSSVVSVIGGRLTLEKVIFQRLTRTSGLGGAALDCKNAASITIGGRFSNCHSKTGLCGAIHLNATDLSTIKLADIFFLLNRGCNESVAHDIHLSTINVDDFISKFHYYMDSASLSPHIVDDDDKSGPIDLLTVFHVYGESDSFNQIKYCPSSFTPSDVEALDLSSPDFEKDGFGLYLSSIVDDLGTRLK